MCLVRRVGAARNRIVRSEAQTEGCRLRLSCSPLRPLALALHAASADARTGPALPKESGARASWGGGLPEYSADQGLDGHVTLDPADQDCDGVVRLAQVDRHESPRGVIREVGRSQPTVSARLQLLSLPVEEQEAVRSGYLKTGAAVRMARVASGHVGKKGVSRAWHLGPDHALSSFAAARCRRLKHKVGRSVGGMACGECWESVIRADERQHLHQVAAQQGRCAVCGDSKAVDALVTPVPTKEDS